MSKRSTNTWLPWLLLAIVIIGVWLAWPRPEVQPQSTPAAGGAVQTLPPIEAPRPLPPVSQAPASRDPSPRASFLPDEARDTIALIQRGGPYPHRQDGGVFGNREGRLPRKPRGWYREFTVDTPGVRHRGARRIVTGGTPPSEWYYTDDHYDSFRRFEVTGGPQ
jgi:guanyl-specific ribonuclease Sa